MTRSTPDICDALGEKVQVADPVFRHFGGKQVFSGEIATVRCFEDNSKVGESVRAEGKGRVLVVDGGGSLRRSLLGDKLAKLAMDNGWAGILVYGCVRDVEETAEMAIGIMALNTIPRKTEKRGEGRCGVPLAFASLRIEPGQHLYADLNGIVIADSDLSGSAELAAFSDS